MGLGSNTKKKKIYYLSLRATKEDSNKKKIIAPHFKVTMTDENGAKHILPDETELTGFLVAIDHGEYEWPENSGKKNKKIMLYIVDGDCMYKVEASVNSNMSRSLMNSIAGTQKYDSIKLSLYEKKGYPNLSVRNGTSKEFKKRFDYKTELAPKITEAPDPSNENKTIKIYHTVNRMLWDAWIATEPIVEAYAKEKGFGSDTNTIESNEENRHNVQQAKKIDQDFETRNYQPNLEESAIIDDLPF